MVAGLTGTLVGGIAIVYALARADLVELNNSVISSPGEWLSWAYTNLGSSIPVFAILLIAFFVTLGRLRKCLDDERPVNQVVQLDHLTDIWTTLFFGTGVIWTAIGMRNALLFALGDPASTVDEGAIALLQRMVDGGILVALSTTIFGGVGGYLMRVIKTVAIGAELRKSYAEHGRADAVAIRERLDDMNRNLKDLGRDRPE